jgi:hypothetical protein
VMVAFDTDTEVLGSEPGGSGRAQGGSIWSHPGLRRARGPRLQRCGIAAGSPCRGDRGRGHCRAGRASPSGPSSGAFARQ